MKKVLLSAVLLTFVFTVSAQFHSGFKMGLNLGKIKAESTNKYEVNNPGLNIGIPFNVVLTDFKPIQLSLQPELLISQKGAKSKNTLDTSMFSQTNNYIEIPVMIKARYNKSAFKPFVNLGPYFGYYVMNYAISKQGDEWDTVEVDFADSAYENTMDVGMNIGAGFNAGGFLCEIRYGLGFSNYLKSYLGDKIKSKNRILSFTIGYLIAD